MKKLIKLILYMTYILGLIVLTYSMFILYRGYGLYATVKTPNKGWEGQMHQGDKVLGYKPRAKVGGYERLAGGEKIPMWYNEQGFREPLIKKTGQEPQRPLLLFLGCSFTFGSACLAEDTFPFILGDMMKGKVLNAGVCSYGFAHTVLRARELIPKYKPDFVFVQWSPWHVKRAVSMYRPTPDWSLPMPYMALVNGKNVVEPPPFVTRIFALPINKFKDTEKSFSDFMVFLKDVVFPLLIHEDFNRIRTEIGLRTGAIPRPNTKMTNIEKDVFNELYKICRQNGSVMVVIVLGNMEFMNQKMPSSPDLVFVNAEKDLWDNLEDKSRKEYDLTYKHIAGDPPHVVDHHPNKKAHRIIAKAVFNRLIEYAAEMNKIKNKALLAGIEKLQNKTGHQ